MEIKCTDFIRRGEYSVKDIQHYFQALKEKWANDEKNYDTSAQIDASLVGITKSYEDLLSCIDRKKHPHLHESIENGIKKLKNLLYEVNDNRR